MSGFTLSIRRVDDEAHPTIAERLLLEVDWAHLPRTGERVTVGGGHELGFTVCDVFHEDDNVAVDLGTKAIDERIVEDLALCGWTRRPMSVGALAG